MYVVLAVRKVDTIDMEDEDMDYKERIEKGRTKIAHDVAITLCVRENEGCNLMTLDEAIAKVDKLKPIFPYTQYIIFEAKADELV